MQNAQEIYKRQIAHWSSEERLQLASLILNDLTAQSTQNSVKESVSILELIKSFPSGRGFKTSAEADEFLRQERDSWER
jgi:hypothetical protein